MKILVCIDGSKHSEKVIQEASKIAEAMEALNKDVAVTVIHVYKRRYTKSAWYLSKSEETSAARELIKQMEMLDDLENIERARVLEEVAAVFKKKNIEVDTMLREGHPAEKICEAASAEGFDLIVIGSRGRGARRELFLGSVSNDVVQNAKTNVFVVKITGPLY